MNLDFSKLDIGQYHNNTVIALYNGINIPEDSAQVETKLWNNFLNLNYDPSILGMSRDDYNQLVNNILNEEKQIGFDVRNWNNPDFINSNAYPYIITIMDTISNFQNVSGLTAKLDSIENVAVSNLTCKDKDLVIATVKIAESSAYLWADPSMGGMGFYKQVFQGEIQQRPLNNHSLVSETTRKVIAAAILSDASSLSTSFFYLAGALIAGAAVPASDVVLLTGIAIRAAAASAFGGFFAWASSK